MVLHCCRDVLQESTVQVGIQIRKGIGGTCPARAAARSPSMQSLLAALLTSPPTFPAQAQTDQPHTAACAAVMQSKQTPAQPAQQAQQAQHAQQAQPKQQPSVHQPQAQQALTQQALTQQALAQQTQQAQQLRAQQPQQLTAQQAQQAQQPKAQQAEAQQPLTSQMVIDVSDTDVGHMDKGTDVTGQMAHETPDKQNPNSANPAPSIMTHDQDKSHQQPGSVTAQDVATSASPAADGGPIGNDMWSDPPAVAWNGHIADVHTATTWSEAVVDGVGSVLSSCGHVAYTEAGGCKEKEEQRQAGKDGKDEEQLMSWEDAEGRDKEGGAGDEEDMDEQGKQEEEAKEGEGKEGGESRADDDGADDLLDETHATSRSASAS